MNNNESSREINYFKIGSFVIAGLALIIIAIILLSSGIIFQKKLYIETYFNESVQGLSIGSPVKYRGLEIGHVSKIAFVNQIYHSPKTLKPPYNRYIYVQMAITSSFLTESPTKHEESFATKEINSGLRIKLAMQGLTGNAFVELNYVDPKLNPPLAIDWTPKNYYIPSAKSALNKFTDNVQTILDDLKQVKFQSVFNNFENLTNTTNRAMRRMDYFLRHSGHDISSTVKNVSEISQTLKSMINQAEGSPSQLLLGGPPKHLNPENL